MSGIRQKRAVYCPQCGNSGIVEYGMALLGSVTEKKEFRCSGCGESLTIEGQRAILRLVWKPEEGETAEQPPRRPV